MIPENQKERARAKARKEKEKEKAKRAKEKVNGDPTQHQEIPLLSEENLRQVKKMQNRAGIIN